MKLQPDDASVRNIYYGRQLQQSEQFEPLLLLYIQDAVQKV